MAAGWRNALAAIGVLAFLAALIGVPAAVDAVLPDDGPLPPGERIDVGHGVSVRPPDGARLDLGDSRPGSGDVVLLWHGLRVALTAVQVRERPDDYVSHTRRKLHRDDGLLVGDPVGVRTSSGDSGQRFDLRVEAGSLSDRRPGCASVFTGAETGVVAVISPVRGCADVPAPVWNAVTSLTFTPVRSW